MRLKCRKRKSDIILYRAWKSTRSSTLLDWNYADTCFTAARGSVLAGCYTQVPHRSTLHQHKTPLGNMALSTAWQISRGPANSSTTGVWDVLVIYLVLSRAEEEVMRECDVQHTRAIKTNSAVNLSRKPGLDLCCDLLQHVQGVPRTCSFYIIIRTSILLVPASLN